MNLDLGAAAAWLGALTAIITPLIMVVRVCYGLLKRLKDLEQWTKKQQADIQSGKEERRVLMTGTLACLEGLHEQGCNGPVTKAIREMKQFMLHESHKGQSNE